MRLRDMPDEPQFVSAKVLEMLNKRMGFRSRNPNAFTPAERKQRWRMKNGTQVNAKFDLIGSAALVYIKNQWGFKSNAQAVEAAVRFLAVETRKGLTKINLEID
jgi:hypothetical protein